MNNLGFYYDPARCVGCKACQAACKEKNKLAAGEFCRRADAVEADFGSERKWVHFSGACSHCEHPACVEACPTGAMSKSADGTVQHSDELCIGCGRCVHRCLYGAPFLNRRTGYAQKCDACIDRRRAGREPSCVEACPMRALYFGDLASLQERLGAGRAADLPFLPPPEATSPRLLLRGAAARPSPPAKEAAGTPAPADPEPHAGSTADIVILGGGAAAVSAAREIRRRSKTARVTILSREKRLPYSRPMLSKGLLNGFSIERYPIVNEAWLRDNSVAFLGSAEVTALDVKRRTVTLADGRTIPYDKCIYALGADCFVPPIPGRELPGVFTVRTDRDLHGIRQAMLTARRAVVIGGGITGLEMAWELKKAGLAVTVVELLDHLMERILDSRSAGLLRAAVEAAGIGVITGSGVTQIGGGGQAGQVYLANGSALPADLVILSAGYRANTALASAAGLAADHAVAVGDRMETSDPNVFACGDCTIRGGGTWMQSILQGQTAGASALGAEARYAAGAEPSVVHTAETSLLAVGDLGKRPDRQYRFVYGRAAGDGGRFCVNPRPPRRMATDFTFCLFDGRVTGAALVGSLEPMPLAQDAVRAGWDFETLRKAALEKGVELIDR